MNRLTIVVEDITTIILTYNRIRVYTDTTSTGNFTTLDGTATLAAGQEVYEYIDSDGTSATYYKVSYYHSTNTTESDKSAVQQGATLDSYAMLQALKTSLQIALTDTADDWRLAEILLNASRWVDRETYREDNEFTPATETRYFTAQRSDELLVDDLLSVTTLKTDDDGDRTYENTWASTDYDLEPYNKSPKWKVSITPDGDYSFPAGVAKGVEIAGSWGYASSVPKQVEEATLLYAKWLWFSEKAPSGRVGGEDMGTVSGQALDLVARRMLQPYRKLLAV